jgi:hypothetical protein
MALMAVNLFNALLTAVSSENFLCEKVMIYLRAVSYQVLRWPGNATVEERRRRKLVGQSDDRFP